MAVDISLDLKAGIRVNKITAAKQQLETAVMLIFKEYDYIPIHTLAAAASQILEDLCEAKGVKSESYTMFVHYVSDNALSKEARIASRQHYNFFKHADRDPEDIIQLPDPKLAYSLIYKGIKDYERLGYDQTEVLSTFYIWLLIQIPDSLDSYDTRLYKCLDETHKATEKFSQSEMQRFGLLMLHLRQKNEDAAIDLIQQLRKSTNRDVLAIIRKFYACG